MVVTGCAKLSIEFDVQLGKHIENLRGELCCVISILDVLCILCIWLRKFLTQVICFSVLYLDILHNLLLHCLSDCTTATATTNTR